MTFSLPDIIVFGGTFDPPHSGHLECLQSALKRFPQSEFLIMPAALAPVIGTKTPSQFPFAERLRLCQNMFGQLKSLRVKVSDFELDRPQPNYTFNTLQALQENFPGKTIGFLMGLDQFKNLDRWKNYRELLLQFALIVARRNEVVEEKIQSDRYQDWMEKFIEKCGCDIREIKGLYYLNDVNSPESSSEIRQNLQRIHG